MRILLLFLVCAAQLKGGNLLWEEPEKTIKAKLSDNSVETEFEFKNVSNKPVEILNIRSSCGCIASEMKKKSYQPGESGKIKVTFTIGKLSGIQEKQLAILMTDSAADLLTLTVDIEDRIKKNKDRLTWAVADPLESQSFEITLPEGQKGKVTDVMVVGESFHAKLQEVVAGKTYLITVRPLKTDAPAKGSIRIEIFDPAPHVIYLPVAVEG